MMNRLIASTLNSTVLALIALTAGATVLLAYLGLTELFNGQATSGGCALFAAMAPGLASLKLFWFRNKLARIPTGAPQPNKVHGSRASLQRI
jgi:hypothetical protein